MAHRWIPLTSPLFFHFTVPLNRQSFPQLHIASASLESFGQFIQILYVHTSISKIPNISNISLTQNITATALFCVFN
jgi:hypothetical protein